MYEALSGYVVSKSTRFALIGPGLKDNTAAHGCGFIYKVILAQRTADVLTKEQFTTLLIYHQKSEFADKLFGFGSHEDRDFFLDLLNVDKVGPTAAMAVLSLAPVKDLKQAIRLGRSDYLQNARGVAKSADQIVLKLQKKYMAEHQRDNPSSGLL